jgi:C4-dicarboxylate-specific signal transduction histidine kinase
MSDPCTGPWRKEAEKQGFLASASFVINFRGLPIGAITFYASEKDVFDTALVELLVKMQGDITFALENIDKEARRLETESALKEEIYERLKVVEILREKEQLLVQQNRLAAMGEMVNNIAHQWRQPLNSLGLAIQQLPLFYDSPRFTREFLSEKTGKAMSLIQYMSRTIDDFRNFFSTDKEMKLFEIKQVIEHAVALVEDSFREKEITVNIRIDGDIKVKVFYNEYTQVLVNILSNAQNEFVERNVINALVSIHAFEEGNCSVVTITDNAGGIGSDIIEKIFEPYFTTKGPDKGTGIGLFMSKIIIENNMSGHLTVSNCGNGAEFRIEVKNTDD